MSQKKGAISVATRNHLAIDCKLDSPKAQSPKNSESKAYKPLKIIYKPDKPYYHCGSKFHSIYECEEYHALYYYYYQPKSNLPYRDRKPVN